MVKVNSVVSLLALSSNALAFGRQPNRQPYEEYVTCTTELGPKVNHHVPTHWNYKTRTVTFTERFTTTPHPTITPTKTKTKSVTDVVRTVTTEAASTDIATTTITSTSYFTTTNIVTETDTSTVDTTTTTTPTTTIAAPADFTPISQESGYVAKIKGRSVNSLLERGTESLQCKKGPGGPTFWPPLHPQSITCTKVIEPIVIKRITYTAKACTRTARPKTTTVTTTIKQTHTDTVWPCDVTSTVTASTSTVITSAIDSTTTTTATSTTTISTVAPLQTFQAVCGPDNIISSANGGSAIVGLETSAQTNGNFVPVSGASTSYDCCVSCFNTAACRGSLFQGSECILLVGTDGVCRANQFNGQDGFYTEPGSFSGTASNGPCGLLADKGTL
ncbi:hypothetical protein ACHAQJ_007679 [Trichoderma viride]